MHTDAPAHESNARSHLTIQPFGTTANGAEALHFWLENDAGMRVGITNYGGIVTHIEVPDREGNLADVALGFEDLKSYHTNASYLGAIVGRFANRIARGEFTLDGKKYSVTANEFPNGNPGQLHGGKIGWDQAVWQAVATIVDGVPTVRLQHFSPDGDEGYPGAVDVTVVYRLLQDNALEISYSAISDAPTPINLTNHSYFNLRGEGHPSIAEHMVRLHADRFTPIDENFIPTGELRPVEGTALDFRSAHAIGERIDADEDQLRKVGGYDHNFVLNKSEGRAFVLAAEVYEPTSGRVLETWTSEPGIQLYTANSLDGSQTGKSNRTYGPRSAFCLETQHFPDSPNHPTFPSSILEPGKPYQSRTVYRFKTR